MSHSDKKPMDTKNKWIPSFIFTVMVVLIFVSCDPSEEKDVRIGGTQVVDSSFQISSPNFTETRPKKRIPEKHTCYGEDSSPPLNWTGVPEGTKTFALIADEPENETGRWVHWVLYDIPAFVTELQPAISSSTLSFPDGVIQGINDFKDVGYAGPCPPPLVLAYTCASNTDYSRPPKYVFRLYALDIELSLHEGATAFELEQAMKGHILAQTETAGKFTTPLGIHTKEGEGFMATTRGLKPSRTPPNVRLVQGCN